MFIQAEVTGLLEFHKIKWSEEFLTESDGTDDKTYHVLVALKLADLVREPSFELIVKKDKKFIDNMVSVAREMIKSIQDTSGPDDARIEKMAVRT